MINLTKHEAGLLLLILPELRQYNWVSDQEYDLLLNKLKYQAAEGRLVERAYKNQTPA